MARGLNLKQLAFVKHYLGTDETIAGNATACYRIAYQSKAAPKTVNAMASKLMASTKIKRVIEAATRKAVDAVNWSARTVLDESVMLYNRCMGYEPHPVEVTTKDPKTGEYVTTIVHHRSFNPAGARAALELIGRNTGIQAFQDNVEVSHTHYLEQALAKRAKAVEARAASLTVVPVLPGSVDRTAAPGRESEAGDQVLPMLPGPGDAGDQADLPGLEVNQVEGRIGGSLPAAAPGQSDRPGRRPGTSGKEGASSGGQANVGSA